MFIPGTKVYPNDDIPEMPVSGFKFKKIDEIKTGNFREELLVGMLHLTIFIFYFFIPISFSLFHLYCFTNSV
jgi:hypothetical protein